MYGCHNNVYINIKIIHLANCEFNKHNFFQHGYQGLFPRG